MQILRPRDEARAAEEASGCGGNLPDPSKRTPTLRLFPAPSPWLLVEMNSVPPSVPLAVLACSLRGAQVGNVRVGCVQTTDASHPKTPQAAVQFTAGRLGSIYVRQNDGVATIGQNSPNSTFYYFALNNT
jgi:hypothetical protein